MQTEPDNKNRSFYVIENGSDNKVGPLTREGLLLGIVSKKYKSTTYAWTGGLKDWLQLSDAYWDKIGLRVKEEISFLVTPPPPKREIEPHLINEKNNYSLVELAWIKEGSKNLACFPKSTKKFTGIVFEKYESGKLELSANFKNGVKCGEEFLWYKNSQKKQENYWKEGKLEGLRTKWYENGQKSCESNFKNHKRVGEETHFHANGKKSKYVTFNEGVPNGITKEWGFTGELKLVGLFKNGAQDGLWTYYNRDGFIYRQTSYVAGRQTSYGAGVAKGDSFKTTQSSTQSSSAINQTKSNTDSVTLQGVGCLGSLILCPLSFFLIFHYDTGDIGDESAGQFWVVIFLISFIVGLGIFLSETSNSNGSNSSASNAYRMTSMHQRQQQLREMREMNDNMSDMF